MELEVLQQRIEKSVKNHNVPAIGIALVNRDGPVWVAGWGKADLKTGRAADQDTLFRIGSVTKMFAGLAVLKLVDEGKLSLDDKVRDRAPDLAFENAWEATHPVRIAHLLEHTTGWDDLHVAEYVHDFSDTTTLKQCLDHHPDSRTSRWPPGARQAYNNIGPAVAAYIVEKVTGQRFEDYIEKEFFTPLGMASTSYFKTKLYDERGATLYLGEVPQVYWQIIHRPSGSINSSARDMSKFVQFMLMRGSDGGWANRVRSVNRSYGDTDDVTGQRPRRARGLWPCQLHERSQGVGRSVSRTQRWRHGRAYRARLCARAR